MSDLAMTKTEHWGFRFTVMLSLALIVAVMGLALNSAAVVIGAMLLAPLMQPVLASGATLAMALFSRSVLALGKVFLATTWCIALAYVVWWLLPDQVLTDEIYARTQPDIKDLVVALAAGTAGAYATVRSDASSSLPGVAVAVALVPPLATVGIALQAGETSEAWGALLLYSTNLAAIIFASILVFIATGFVPPRRVASNLTRLIMAAIILGVVVSLVAVPLYQESAETTKLNQDKEKVRASVDAWLTPEGEETDSDNITSKFNPVINIDSEKEPIQVTVELSGFDQPPAFAGLKERVEVDVPGSEVLVSWDRAEQGLTTTVPTTIAPNIQRELEIKAQSADLVQEWLTESGLEFRFDEETGVIVDGSSVTIEAAGDGESPPANELKDLLSDELDVTLAAFFWTERELIDLNEDVPTPLEQTRARMTPVVEDWASRRQLQLQSFTFDGERVEIDVAGDTSPTYTQLERSLRELADDSSMPVRVFFTQRQLVTTTVPVEIPIGNDP